MPETFDHQISNAVKGLQSKLSRHDSFESPRVTVKNITRTVKATDGDFTGIQEAIDYFDGQILAGVTIDVEPGTYTENLLIDGFVGLYDDGLPSLTLLGDDRVLAGMSYVSSNGGNLVPGNLGALTNGGSGNVTLANLGAVLTVTMSVTNPDFQSDGWQAGDLILVFDNAGVWAEHTILSVAANAITLTAAAPAVGNLGTSMTLLPNRRLECSVTAGIKITGQASFVHLSGWTIVQNTNTQACIVVEQSNQVFMTRCATKAGAHAILVNSYGRLGYIEASCSLCQGDAALANWIGIWGNQCSFYLLYWHILTQDGYYGVVGDFTTNRGHFRYGIVVGGQYGAYVQNQSFCDFNFTYFVQAVTAGIYAQYNCFVAALTTSARMISVVTPYSPAAALTEGNWGAWINWT